MRHNRLALTLALSLAAALGTGSLPITALAADATPDRPRLEADMPQLLKLYKELHLAPELSRMEEKTAARLASELRALGFTVTEGIGKYFSPGYKGYGLVGVMKNGDGPTVLVRADMDALPVEEKTGLPYASTVKVRLPSGQETGVMHACGHDIHVTSLVGTARQLVAMKSQWRGTLILLGQPAEETIDGAVAMVRDGLYDKVPKPDYVIALHDWSGMPAGRVGVTSGPAMAQSTQIDIRVRGVGGHGSAPQTTRDPVVLAASIVMQLQTIVSRSTAPQEHAVLTVGTIHGGTKRNIIPEEVKLELNMRSYNEDTRQTLIAGVRRVARGAAIAMGVPEDRMPEVTVIDAEFAPVVINDPKLNLRVEASLRKAVGAENVDQLPAVMGSEDFGRLGLDGKFPTVMFRVGAVNPAEYAKATAEGTVLPSTHSPLFAPDPEPTLRTGILGMTQVVLDLMPR